jgi:hypothetical protein
MRIDPASSPSSPDRPNEDYLAVAVPASGFGGIALVLDGVTPPTDGRTGCLHTVPWYTAHLGGGMVEIASRRRDLDLPGCLAEAVARTAAAHGPVCDLRNARTPQATVAALRWDDEHVEYLVLSDSAVLAESMDGTVKAVRDDRLDKIVRRPAIHALRAERHALPRGSPARAEVSHRLANAIESLRNVDGGFFTAAADPDVARRATSGTWPRQAIRSVAALTDGATRFTEVFRLGDWTTLLATLAHDGAQALLDRVRAKEADDPDGRLFPRGKTFDDASVVYVGF